MPISSLRRPEAIHSADDAEAALRELLRQAGLDAPHADRPDWNPFGAYVRPGGTVFVLPNLVQHRLPRETAAQFRAKCTDGPLVAAIVALARRAVGPAGRVLVGCAPIQSCVWERVIADTGLAAALAASTANAVRAATDAANASDDRAHATASGAHGTTDIEDAPTDAANASDDRAPAKPDGIHATPDATPDAPSDISLDQARDDAPRDASPAKRPAPQAELVDLRGWISTLHRSGRIIGAPNPDAPTPVAVDLGADSALDELPPGAHFRVADYDHRRTEACHGRGRHLYLLHPAPLAADLVISVPKIKTHSKVGATLAVKGCVGTVEHKDCLAHHRRGDPRDGGDEFPRANPLLALASWAQDHRGAAMQIVGAAARAAAKRLGARGEGSWGGNDTAWRMAVDLARIVAYAAADGTMHDEPQRRHVAIYDGLVAGEGEGPLRPTPVEAGTLVFADDVLAGDRFVAAAMGFAPSWPPVVAARLQSERWPLESSGAEAHEGDAPQLIAGRPFVPPPGWSLAPR